MLYSKFIYHAKEKTINQLDNDIWYLEPEWKDIICREIESNLSNLEDSYLSDWWDVENILRLEVERRNSRDSNKKEVIDWIYDIITQTVDPVMLEEETDFVKNIIEYMKTNHEIQKDKPDNIVPFPTN